MPIVLPLQALDSNKYLIANGVANIFDMHPLKKPNKLVMSMKSALVFTMKIVMAKGMHIFVPMERKYTIPPQMIVSMYRMVGGRKVEWSGGAFNGG